VGERTKGEKFPLLSKTFLLSNEPANPSEKRNSAVIVKSMSVGWKGTNMEKFASSSFPKKVRNTVKVNRCNTRVGRNGETRRECKGQKRQGIRKRVN